MHQEIFQDASILIIDDQEPNVQLLETILRGAGYSKITCTTDSRMCLPLFVETQPDLVLLDLRMPHLSGFEVMSKLKPLIPAKAYLPIVVLTADITHEARREALAQGAYDFLTKPLDPVEVLLRINNLLRTRFLQLQLQNRNDQLESKVRERTQQLVRANQELQEAHMEVLERLALAAEYHDDETGQHTYRVTNACVMLARALGIAQEEVDLIRRAASLHDVGKIAVPDSILLKPGRLTPAEFEVMKSHTVIGAQILSGGRSDLVKMAQAIALTHHERWDGSGYPEGLKGEEIPLAGRIVAVADVFDALTHDRPYKAAWPVEAARAEIARQSARQFDPRVVEAFLKLDLAAVAEPNSGAVSRSNGQRRTVASGSLKPYLSNGPPSDWGRAPTEHSSPP